MKQPHLQKLADKSHRAANEMVTALVAAIFAGNEGITSEAAGRVAMEAAEYILSRIVPTEKDKDLEHSHESLVCPVSLSCGMESEDDD